MIQPENSEMKTLTEGIICTVVLFGIISYLMLSMGVVTLDSPKENITPIETSSVIVETPTETPTPEPTPTPVPTTDWNQMMIDYNGHPMREYASWYRENVSGYLDLTDFVTIYGYKRMPFFHYHSWSWGTGAFFKQSPPEGYDYLFVFVNMYSQEGSARQWLFRDEAFTVHIGDKVYYPDEEISKTNGIQELYETWDYAHVQDVQPYGYKIIQEAGTGIITAQVQEYLRAGRSNAQDGWILFQIPASTDIKNVTVYGYFSNLGGTQWWHLE